MLSIVAAILLIGNIEFEDKNYNENCPCEIVNKDVIKRIGSLLSIDERAFIKSITLKTREAPK